MSEFWQTTQSNAQEEEPITVESLLKTVEKLRELFPALSRELFSPEWLYARTSRASLTEEQIASLYTPLSLQQYWNLKQMPDRLTRTEE